MVAHVPLLHPRDAAHRSSDGRDRNLAREALQMGNITTAAVTGSLGARIQGRSCLRRRRSGERIAASVVKGESFGATSDALMKTDEPSVHFLDALVDLERLEVAVRRPVEVSGCLEDPAQFAQPAPDARLQPLAWSEDPRLVLFASEQRSAIEAERGIDERGAVRTRRLGCQAGLEGADIDPDAFRIQVHPSSLAVDRLVVAEESPQTVERHGQGVLRSVSVRIRPERIRDVLLGNVVATESDERLEQLERLALRLRGEHDGATVDYHAEAT